MFTYFGPQNSYYVEVYQLAADFAVDPIDFLNNQELMQLNNFIHEKRRRQYLQSRYYLKKKISEVCEIESRQIEFEIIDQGKPVLKNNPRKIDFSISHIDDFFAIGLSEIGQIGVDLEALRQPQNPQGVMAKVFTADEIKAISGSSDFTAAFIRTWSAKEAIIKAAAGGVFRDSLDVQINLLNSEIEKLPGIYGGPSQWDLKIFENIPGHILCVAFSHGHQQDHHPR